MRELRPMGELVNRRRRGVAGLVSMVLGAACLVWALPGNAGASSDEQLTSATSEVGDNATCGQLAPEGANWTELKVEPVVDGTFTDGTLTVTIEVTGFTDDDEPQVFDWTSNIGVDAVFVKGGPGGLLYIYDPESTGDTGLHAPVNPNNGKFFGLSHVSFCYDEDQATTTTEGPTTSTTEGPTTTTEGPTTSTTEGPTTSTTEGPTTSTTEGPTTSTTEGPTTSTTEGPTTSTTEGPTTSTTEGPTTSTTEGPTTSTTEGPTTSTTEGPTTSTTEATSTTAVAPSSTTTSMAVSPIGELPKTGGGSQLLLIVAGITLLLGGGALLGSAKLGQGRLADGGVA
jgi:LPXTG-motif cell wall-anchored protein